jgi:glycosyltransferase involved in cell wall biosynthesis
LKSDKNQKTSIVICYKNEENIIDTSLPIILKQEYDELVLVNDNSTDQTLEKLNAYGSDKIKIISTTSATKGKKHALYLGIRAAKYDSILLTDADCEPVSENWAGIMKNYNSSFVLGYGPMKKTKGLVGMFSRFETYMTALQYFSFALLGIPYMGVGRNIKIERSIVLSQKDLIKGHHLASGDDDLMINALSTKENTIICIEPESFVYSNPKTTLKGFLDQKTRHISTSPFYKTLHKLLLAAFSGSYILFFVILTIGITTGTISIKKGLIILVVKWVIQQVVNFNVMTKLKEKDLFWKFPFLDLLFFFYLLIMPLYYFFNKKHSDWN